MQDISDIHLNMHHGTQTEDLILGQKEDLQDDRSDIQMTCSVREQRLERMRRREVERQRQSGSSEVQQLILRLGQRLERRHVLSKSSLQMLADNYRRWREEVDRKKNEQELQDHFHFRMTQLNDDRDSVEKKLFKHLEKEEILYIIDTFDEARDKLKKQLDVAQNAILARHEEEIRVKEKKQHSLSLHLLETDDLMTLNQDLMRTICRGLSQLTSGHVVSLCPECPVCLETIRPLSAIVQCVSGHLLCLHCARRLVVLVCPTCRGRSRVGRESWSSYSLVSSTRHLESRRDNILNSKLFLVQQ